MSGVRRFWIDGGTVGVGGGRIIAEDAIEAEGLFRRLATSGVFFELRDSLAVRAFPRQRSFTDGSGWFIGGRRGLRSFFGDVILVGGAELIERDVALRATFQAQADNVAILQCHELGLGRKAAFGGFPSPHLRPGRGGNEGARSRIPSQIRAICRMIEASPIVRPESGIELSPDYSQPSTEGQIFAKRI